MGCFASKEEAPPPAPPSSAPANKEHASDPERCALLAQRRCRGVALCFGRGALMRERLDLSVLCASLLSFAAHADARACLRVSSGWGLLRGAMTDWAVGAPSSHCHVMQLVPRGDSVTRMMLRS